MITELQSVCDIDITEKINQYPNKDFSFFWATCSLETLNDKVCRITDEIFKGKRKMYPLGKVLFEIKNAIEKKYSDSRKKPSYLKRLKISYSYINNYMPVEIHSYFKEKINGVVVLKLDVVKCYIRSYKINDEVKLVTLVS